MAITNYGELKTAVANWLNRDDLTSIIPDFITLAQARINRDLEGVRERRTQNVSTEFPAITPPVGDIVSLAIASYGPVQMITQERVAYFKQLYGSSTGLPKYAAFVPAIEGGGVLQLVPAPDTTYTLNMVYRPQYAAFSADADTDDILTYSPDIYLFGALAESAPYLKDDERTALWEKKFSGGLESLRLSMLRRRYPSTPIIRPRRPLGE